MQKLVKAESKKLAVAKGQGKAGYKIGLEKLRPVHFYTIPGL